MIGGINIKAVTRFGYQEHYSNYLNDKIKLSNQLSLVMILLGSLYGGFCWFFIPDLYIYPLGAAVIAVFVIFLNKYHYHQTARSIIGMEGIILAAIFHAGLVDEGEVTLNPFYLAQFGMAIIPWILFDLREKYFLIPISVICLLVLFFQEKLNYMIPAAEGSYVIKESGLYQLNYWFASIFYISALFLLQRKNYKTEMENKELIDEVNRNNEELQAQQEELSSQNEELSITLNRLKDAQMQMVQSEKMASLGILTAGIAHEINNPVNFISAGIVGLKKTLKHLTSVMEEYRKINNDNYEEQLLLISKMNDQVDYDQLLQMVNKVAEDISIGANRTTEIIKSLRTFSRTEEYEIKPVNLHEGLDSTLVLLRNQYKDRISIIKDYQQIPSVECNPGKVNQVFMNIILNGIQAIEGEGEIKIKTELVTDAQLKKLDEELNLPTDNYVSVSIQDSGCGISSEDQNLIFQPFYTTKEIGQGTGLGLSISNSIIKSFGGRIMLNSENKKGTTFQVFLPVKQQRTD